MTDAITRAAEYIEVQALVAQADAHYSTRGADYKETRLSDHKFLTQLAEELRAEREALRGLLHYAETSACKHDVTYRGGAIWTICAECGMRWADDKGGFQPYEEPAEITEARSALKETD